MVFRSRAVGGSWCGATGGSGGGKQGEGEQRSQHGGISWLRSRSEAREPLYFRPSPRQGTFKRRFGGGGRSRLASAENAGVHGGSPSVRLPTFGRRQGRRVH